jgi:hypothetical protein
MAQIAHLSDTIAPSGAGGQAVAHGLVRTPEIICLLHGSGAAISVGTTAADENDIYIANAGGGPQQAEILVMAPHSIIA